MCYNCGCGLPNDPMGHGHAGKNPEGKAITDETFREAANAFGMSIDEVKKETLKLLQEQVANK